MYVSIKTVCGLRLFSVSLHYYLSSLSFSELEIHGVVVISCLSLYYSGNGQLFVWRRKNCTRPIRASQKRCFCEDIGAYINFINILIDVLYSKLKLCNFSRVWLFCHSESLFLLPSSSNHAEDLRRHPERRVRSFFSWKIMWSAIHDKNYQN